MSNRFVFKPKRKKDTNTLSPALASALTAFNYHREMTAKDFQSLNPDMTSDAAQQTLRRLVSAGRLTREKKRGVFHYKKTDKKS